MTPGEKYALNAESSVVRAHLRRRVPGEGRLRPVAGSGPEARLQPQPLPLQLALALGLRQRRQRQPGSAPVRHRALGPEQERAPGEDQPIGRLLRRPRASQETPNVQTALFEYADGKILEFAHPRRASRTTRARRRSATCSTAARAGSGSTATAARGSRTSAARTRRGPGREATAAPARAATRTCSRASSRRTTRTSSTRSARAIRKILTCDILEEGHLSPLSPHLGNIAYRVKRPLRFDGKTERFVGDKDADKLLTRTYRAPYVISEKV